MVKVQRHLSIHFNTRFFKGITHEEILSGIEKKVELDNVDLKFGYSQTITELNAYTVNKPTTHPTHVDRNQHGKSDAIIVTIWVT